MSVWKCLQKLCRSERNEITVCVFDITSNIAKMNQVRLINITNSFWFLTAFWDTCKHLFWKNTIINVQFKQG